MLFLELDKKKYLLLLVYMRLQLKQNMAVKLFLKQFNLHFFSAGNKRNLSVAYATYSLIMEFRNTISQANKSYKI